MKIANIVERVGIGIKNGDEDLTSCKGRTHISLDSKEEGRDESRSVGFVQKVLESELPREERGLLTRHENEALRTS